ncbi:MAG: hypothetical protein WBP54_10190, partial [Pelodictyon phaeoclathratiforme]
SVVEFNLFDPAKKYFESFDPKKLTLAFHLTTNSKNLTLLDQGKPMYIFSGHLQNLFFLFFSTL